MNLLATLRQYRVGPFTIFDVATAYVGIFLLAPLLTKLFLKMHLYVPRKTWLWWTLPIGVIFHIVLRIDSPLMRMLSNPDSFIVPTLVLVVMTCVGVKDVKVVHTVPQYKNKTFKTGV